MDLGTWLALSVLFGVVVALLERAHRRAAIYPSLTDRCDADVRRAAAELRALA